MQVVYSPEHLRHHPAHEVMNGHAIGIYELPSRAEAIRTALAADRRYTWTTPISHGLAPIEAVHDPALVAYLADAWERTVGYTEGVVELVPDTFLHPAMREGMGPAPRPSHPVAALGTWVFDTATPLVEGTYAAALASVDVALTGLDLVLGGEQSAYALCRPPGHHATRSAYGGYCYFNNAAIAARSAIDRGAARVTVLDVDYHHGNGTQQVFYGCGEVQYVSIHADPDRAYPYYIGYADETGAGGGAGTTLNLPLGEDADDDDYLAALGRALADVERFDPEVLVVSLGVDTYQLDPIGDFQVTTGGIGEQGRAIRALGRPTLVVQEGGYHLADLGTNVRAFLSAFC